MRSSIRTIATFTASVVAAAGLVVVAPSTAFAVDPTPVSAAVVDRASMLAGADIDECLVFDELSTPPTATLTDSGQIPEYKAAAFQKSSLTVWKSAQVVGFAVDLADDCLGSDQVIAKLTSTTGATKWLELDFFDDAESGGVVREIWNGAVRFTSADRGTWSLTAVKVVPVTGSIVFDLDTLDLIEDNLVYGSEVALPLLAAKPSIKITTATSTAVDAAPEPIIKGKALTIVGTSVKASGIECGRERVRPGRAPGEGAGLVGLEDRQDTQCERQRQGLGRLHAHRQGNVVLPGDHTGPPWLCGQCQRD